MSDVTQILAEIEQGDAAAAEELLPLVYTEPVVGRSDPLTVLGRRRYVDGGFTVDSRILVGTIDSERWEALGPSKQ